MQFHSSDELPLSNTEKLSWVFVNRSLFMLQKWLKWKLSTFLLVVLNCSEDFIKEHKRFIHHRLCIKRKDTSWGCLSSKWQNYLFQVQVNIHGIPSACLGPDGSNTFDQCNFQWTASSTPALSGVSSGSSEVLPGDVLTIDG